MPRRLNIICHPVDDLNLHIANPLLVFDYALPELASAFSVNKSAQIRQATPARQMATPIMCDNRYRVCNVSQDNNNTTGIVKQSST